MRREMKKEDEGVAWRREMALETGLGWEDGGLLPLRGSFGIGGQAWLELNSASPCSSGIVPSSPQKLLLAHCPTSL